MPPPPSRGVSLLLMWLGSVVSALHGSQVSCGHRVPPLKRYHHLLGALPLVAALSACAPHVLVARPHARVTLTIVTARNSLLLEMEHLTPAFEKQYGITVKYVSLPENILREQVTSDVTTGRGQFDVLTVGTYEVPLWAKAHWIVNLQPHLRAMRSAAAQTYAVADLLPSVTKGLSYQHNLYALPFYAESSMTFYNKRLFKAAHLTMPLHPTWDQIRFFAATLNQPSKGQYGIALRGLPGWGEMGAPLTTMINTFGGEWFNMQWEPQLTSPATKAAIEFYVDLLRKYGEPDATSSGVIASGTLFAQGKAAMFVDATSGAGYFSDPRQSRIAPDVGYAYAPTEVTPKGSHWLWAWALAIDASSPHKDAAFTFMTWATSKHYIRLVAQDRGWENVPPGTRVSTFSTPSYKRVAPYASIILDSMQTADPTDATLHKVPYVGVQFVGIPEFQGIGTTVTQNLARAISGTMTVDAAVQLSQRQTARTMRAAGYVK